MNLVNLERVVKGYGQRTLLDGVSAGVASGERVGVVGPNGAGKTTLLGLLTGTEPPDNGRVTRTRDLRVGYLPQQDRISGTVRQLLRGGRPEHAWAGDARVREVVGALVPSIDEAAPAERLSGGERRRVALAALLAGEHDLLLLDEPTNQLDMEAIGWLAGYLNAQAAALVVVTHDRWFLDAVATRTWELADGRIHAYDGGYAAYVLARAERARIADVAQRRRQNLLRKELAWLRRGAPARTSKPRFRVEAANELIADEPPVRDSVGLLRVAAARLGKTVLDVEDLSVSVGERVLFDHLTWQLGPGERVGVVGPNGSGKTTLLRLLGADPDVRVAHARSASGSGAHSGPHPDADAASARAGAAHTQPPQVEGRVVRGKTVRLGYLEQDDAEIDPALNAREVLAEVRGNLLAAEGGGSIGSLLETVGLRGDRQFTPGGELSGGERRRVQVMRVLVGEPNVLLLDEPTNDLDIDTLTELEDLLDQWAGSMVVVSHDRYFLERVTDHVVALLGDGKLSYLGGGVEEYLVRRAEALGLRRPPRAQSSANSPQRPGSAQPQVVSGEPEGGTTLSAAEVRTARKELQRLERQITRLGEREAELMDALAAHASDYAKLLELDGELKAVQAQRAELEERWLTVAEVLP
ncbi:MAG TPA: ABC-F family ATP-binding cassette domain-containing protein [Streptosporangiaceae bacterium]|nr:ABC-F family ATP-binding cassette domain-containing protein [Streptosporangiaceae bacterium]